MTTPTVPHWADVLTLRDEVRATDGSVGELQMSLAKAVYQTVLVPYAKSGYYTDITEPTPKLVGFLGRVARRLGVADLDAQACFHLDQGMGGGKSHSLVGIWHMVNSPDDFFATDLGQQVKTSAGVGGHPIDLTGTIPVVLTCDGFTPGKTDPRFGPATDLFGRFLWLLFADRADRMDRWQHYMDLGGNKSTLQAVFAEVNRPVLILIDELMDYVMALTDQTAIGGLPGEQAFLNHLTDAVDDQPNVVLVLVMIRSEQDHAGYHPAAVDMRGYLTSRLQRNGETVSVTEPADFANIIRRRLFVTTDITNPARELGAAYATSAEQEAWSEQVYSQLGTRRTAATLQERIVGTYPFHPDMFALVSDEWTVVQAFQRVRSTVSIFARTVLYWVDEHKAGRWAPALIGTGDIPLHTGALEALLSSGVLAENDRAIQGYRAVATTDVINSGGGGTAVKIDNALVAAGVHTGQPHPAVRMATACFAYSLVARPRGMRGATRAELLAAVHDPDVPYSPVEEVLNALVAGATDGGLGALERTKPAGGKSPERLYLSIKQTLTMYHANATGMIDNDQALDLVWTRAQALATKGTFTALHPLTRPDNPATPLGVAFDGVDSQQTRLVVLDPRRWTLLNGRDGATRADLDIAYGVTVGMTSMFAASMVVAVVTTQRRERAKARAKDALAWKAVVAQLAPQDEEHPEAVSRRNDALAKLDESIRNAFQHYGYLLKTAQGLVVQYKTLPDGQTSLSGANVWSALITDSRAVNVGQLSAEYVAHLITTGNFRRNLTPKELFALPYSNPMWPLIATDNDMRTAIFILATSAEWMLVDSDGTEVRPGIPDQIQAATMHQTLRPRLNPACPKCGADPCTCPKPVCATCQQDPCVCATPPACATCGNTPCTCTTPPTYEVTTLRLPDTSVTDLARREQLWHLMREVASLLDPAKAHQHDVQMLGFTLTINARTGDTHALVTKSDADPSVHVKTEADDL